MTLPLLTQTWFITSGTDALSPGSYFSILLIKSFTSIPSESSSDIDTS